MASMQQLAQDAQVKGQQLQDSFTSSANTSRDQYNDFTNKATEANQNLQSETQYMQGEGSGTNVYNAALDKAKTDNGWDPEQLSSANKTLFSLNGALNGANAQFSTPGGVGSYGISAPALASYESGILQPLQTGVANANTQVGVLNNELGTLQTGAGQSTTAQVQSEQNVVAALTEAAKNYQTQAAASLQNMQFFSNLASQQGGLNAQQQQAYAAAEAAYAQATQAIAQSKLLLSQTTGQNITNTAMQNQLNVSTAPKPAAPTPNKAAAAPAASSNPIGSAVNGVKNFVKTTPGKIVDSTVLGTLFNNNPVGQVGSKLLSMF